MLSLPQQASAIDGRIGILRGSRFGEISSAAKTGSMPHGSGTAEITTSPFAGAMGAISGTIVDANDSVIPVVHIKAVEERDNPQTFSATTNDEGYFLIANVPSGKYVIRTEPISGFSAYQMQNVEVASHRLTGLKIVLHVSGAAAVVDVSAGDVSGIDA